MIFLGEGKVSQIDHDQFKCRLYFYKLLWNQRPPFRVKKLRIELLNFKTASRFTPASYVVTLRELSVAIGAFMGYMFLGEKLMGTKITVIVLIVMAMMAIKMV